MEQLKRMIFEVLQSEQKKKLIELEDLELEAIEIDYFMEAEQIVYTEEFKRLIFGIFKENAKTKQLNPCVWLYLNNTAEAFKNILQDITQECYANYLEDKETAYKNTMKYVYNQYYKRALKTTPLEYAENIAIEEQENSTLTIKKLNLKSEKQKQIWQELEQKAYIRLKTKHKLFENTRQKQQAINKLIKYEII